MNIKNLIISPKAKLQIKRYLDNPSHALLLNGVKGTGTGTIARFLAQEIAGPSVLTIQPKIHNKQKTETINIQDIREIYELGGKRRKDKLVIIIDEIDRMTNDAPQAILKLLEEPSDNMLFILTTHDMSAIAGTILSRVQCITIPALDSSYCKTLFEQSPTKLTIDKTKKILFMADGLPAEIYRLSQDEMYFRDMVNVMEMSKKFLTSDTIERLKTVTVIKNQAEAIRFIETLAKMVTFNVQDQKSAQLVATKMKILSEVIDNIKQNGNLKIQLTYLALNL